MSETIVTLIILTFTAMLITIAGLKVIYQSHIDENKAAHYICGMGNFEQFQKEFKQYSSWETGEEKGCFKDKYGRPYYIHGNVFVFNRVCMRLPFLDFYLVKIWLRQEWNRRTKIENKIELWEDVKK